jgi:hypothetical protein
MGRLFALCVILTVGGVLLTSDASSPRSNTGDTGHRPRKWLLAGGLGAMALGPSLYLLGLAVVG